MTLKKIKLNFIEINTLEEMHTMLKDTFGFRDFYGNNVNALIDCLSSLRYPEDGMSKFILNSVDDYLVIELKNFTSRDKIIIDHFLTAIKGVNDKNLFIDTEPSIHLILI